MAKLNIDTGALGNPATGDTLRTAMTKINTNFTELYDSELLSLSQGLIKTVTTNGDIKIQPNGTGQVEIDQLLITSDSITSLVTNGDVTLAGNGTGNVIVEAITVNGTTLSSADSTLITVAEALEVTGAATLGTSLALASGATVTGIDNGALGTSATLLATQGAIKTYVDSQVTVQDLDVASDSGTAAVDLDSQSLTVTGGTGIGTTATGQAVTVNIDATVATLVGSQTLENKTLTTPVITEIDSGADITLDATNDVNIPADVGLTFGDDGEKIEGDGTNLLISSSGLATITATGNTVITNNALVSGNLTVSGNLDVTGTLDLSDSNFTNVGSLQLDSIAGDGDTNTSITFSGSDVITIATGGAGRLTIGDGALTPVTDNQIDLGTSSLEFKDAYFDGTVTSDAFAGPLTGAVTGNADTATTSTNVTVADESSDTTCFPLFTTAASGDLPPKSGTNLTFNSSSGVLTATGFIGALTGTASIASAVVVADESSDTTCFPLFASGATSGQAVKSGSNLTFNSSTGIITATGFAGALTGNVTGNTSGTAATVTGAAQTNITSLGTLTTLTVDDIIINGSTIGRTDDTDLLTLASDALTVAGTISLTGGEVIPGKQGGTNFTDSLLVGHSTTGTLNDAQNNVGVGIGTLDSITSGDNNVAIGKNALTALTTSSNNVAVGLSSAQFLSTSAGGNTSFGNSSLYYNQTGTDNVAIGNSALQGASGQSSSNGVAIGASALEGVTTGSNNIGIGKSAGDNITSGAGNVIIGSINADSATADKQLIIADGVDGSVAWLKGDSAGDLTFGAGITVGGSFQQAVHTFVATDAITVIEHAGRILLLGEVGGNADVVLTLPDATGSGNVYEFIVSVTMASNTYKIACPDADNTITGTIQYLDLDGNAVSAFGTVAASDTITLNGGTQGGQVGDTLTLIDLVANKWMVKGQMRVPAGANPATPFSAAVS